MSEFMDVKDNLFEDEHLPKFAAGQIGFGNYVVRPMIAVRRESELPLPCSCRPA